MIQPTSLGYTDLQLKVRNAAFRRRTGAWLLHLRLGKVHSPCDLRPTFSWPHPKSIKSEKGHSSTSSGNILEISSCVQTPNNDTNVCQGRAVLPTLPHMCTLVTKWLIRTIVAKPAHPPYSFLPSSREHLVTDHGVSVPIYLHKCRRLHGRRCRWAALKCAGNKMSSSFGLKSRGLTSEQALHPHRSQHVYLWNPDANSSELWAAVRIKHDVWEALNGARHIVKMKPAAAAVTEWLSSFDSWYRKNLDHLDLLGELIVLPALARKRALSTSPKLPPPPHYSHTCVAQKIRISWVLCG